MKIDINALLAGGAGSLPVGNLLSGEAFNLKLEDKLAEMGLVPSLLALEVQPLANEPLPAMTEIDGELVSELQAGEVLPALEADAESSPQWQLQQLVTRRSGEPVGQASVKADPAQATAAAPLTPAVAGKAVRVVKAGAAEKMPPLTATQGTSGEITPAPSLVTNPVQSVGQDTVAAEGTPTLAVSAATLSTGARTSLPTAAPAAPTVSHPPETPEWKQSVSQHIAVFARNGVQNAEIRLHPEELGSLHITLRLHQEQAQIHIVSEHAQVRQAMEQALPQLRTAMAESGVQLGQANVSADSASGGAGAQNGEGSGQASDHQAGDERMIEEESVSPVLMAMPGNVYGINTFA